jgi:hypothetical protein
MSDSPQHNWQIVAYDPINLRTNLRLDMAPTTLSYDSAIKQVPSFSGGTDDDLSIFENQCEFLLDSVADSIKPNLLRAIIVKITGGAYRHIKYHTFDSWEQLKIHLRTLYKTKHSINYL